MVDNKLQIDLQLNDKATAGLKKSQKNIKNFVTKSKIDFVSLAAKVYLLQRAFTIIIRMTSQFIKAASKVEQYRTRLTVLFKSVDEGNKVFANMAKLAGEVPKTYDEIMASATNLAGVVRGGVDEISQLMPIIVDISAVTGMSVQEVTGQMIRMYSAGAAAADMFRERGVSAALGFQAKVSVSAEDTMKQIISQWEDGTGKFVGASDELAKTWEGKTSMMEDAWFAFSSALGEFVTKSPEVLTAMKNITKGLNDVAKVLNSVKDFRTGALLEEFYKIQEAIEDTVAPDTGLDKFANKMRDVFGVEQHSRISELTDKLREVTDELIGQGVYLDTDPLKKFFSEEEIEFFKKRSEQVLSIIKDVGKKSTDETKILQDKKLAAIIKFNKDWTVNTHNAFEMVAGMNKEAGIAFQVYQSGRALISTYEAFSEALPNIPLALSVLGLGLAKVAAINSVGFAKGTDTVPAMLSPGEMVIPRTFSDSIREGRLSLSGGGGDTITEGNVINIYIEGGINSEGSPVEMVAEQLGFLIDANLKTARGF